MSTANRPVFSRLIRARMGADPRDLVETCCRELEQRGMAMVPRCLVEDLACAALDPFAPLPPIDYPAAEGHYWARVDQLLRHPRWRRCIRLLRRAALGRDREGVGVLILGVLSVPGFLPLRSPDGSCQRIDNRAELNIPELQVSFLTELMVAATGAPQGDHRMIDLIAVNLYETGLQLEIQAGSLLAARLREVRRLIKGARLGDSHVAIGGLYGISLQGTDLFNVLPMELANRRLFLAKYANDELLYWRRISPSEEEPYVRFRVFINTRKTGGQATPGGQNLTSWAKALALWVCHDLTWHIALQSQSLRYLFEIIYTDAALTQPQAIFRFWLHAVISEFAGELAREQPFLEQVGILLPFFLRSRVPLQSTSADAYGVNTFKQHVAQYRLTDTATYGIPDRDMMGPLVPQTQPIFAYDVTVLAGDATSMANVRMWRQTLSSECATFSLTESACALRNAFTSVPVAAPYDVDRVYELRRQLLEFVVNQMLTSLANW